MPKGIIAAAIGLLVLPGSMAFAREHWYSSVEIGVGQICEHCRIETKDGYITRVISKTEGPMSLWCGSPVSLGEGIRMVTPVPIPESNCKASPPVLAPAQALKP